MRFRVLRAPRSLSRPLGSDYTRVYRGKEGTGFGTLGRSDVAPVWKSRRAFSARRVGFRAEGLKDLQRVCVRLGILDQCRFRGRRSSFRHKSGKRWEGNSESRALEVLRLRKRKL